MSQTVLVISHTTVTYDSSPQQYLRSEFPSLSDVIKQCHVTTLLNKGNPGKQGPPHNFMRVSSDQSVGKLTGSCKFQVVHKQFSGQLSGSWRWLRGRQKWLLPWGGACARVAGAVPTHCGWLLPNGGDTLATCNLPCRLLH